MKIYTLTSLHINLECKLQSKNYQYLLYTFEVNKYYENIKHKNQSCKKYYKFSDKI